MAHTLRLHDEPAGHVELASGRTIAIRAIDNAGRKLLESMQAGTTDTTLPWQLARRMLPDATEAELDALTIPMIAQVARIACAATATPATFFPPHGPVH